MSRYPKPHKDNIVLEDLDRISAAFTLIDEDIAETEGKLSELNTTAKNLEQRVITVPPDSTINTELQDISANNYIVINEDASNFTTREGGGDEGGFYGQCIAKLNDANYQTFWTNPLEISKNRSFVHVVTDTENIEPPPQAEPINYQITSSIESDPNASFILRDAIEQIDDNPEIATNLNYGILKVGDGVEVDGGVISVFGSGKASEFSYGLAKVGEYINVSNGIVSIDDLPTATHSTLGVVKLGDGFELGDQGELKLAQYSGEPVIYKMANFKPVYEGIVDIDPDHVNYRAFIEEDLQFSLNINFEPVSDFTIYLEIISDGQHVVSFDDSVPEDSVPEEVSPLGINRGSTVIKFTRLLGASFWNAEVNRLDAPDPVNLTPNLGDNVLTEGIFTCNGSTWNTQAMFAENTGSNISFQNNPREIYMDYFKSVVVDSVYFYDTQGATFSLFELYGSNDKVNWTRLIYKTDSVIDLRTPTDVKGAFKYFKLVFFNQGSIRGIMLQGTVIGNDDSELILLTHKMTSVNQGGITLTSSGVNAGNLINITNADVNSYVDINKGESDFSFIQYEYVEPKLVNLVEFSVPSEYYSSRCMRWFKLLASNDGESWNLLLEREYSRGWEQCETKYFQLDNETPYRFYKLICMYTEQGTLWSISRFRLYRRESGTSGFINCLPHLSHNGQDGYEVSASSEYNSSEGALSAFDGNENTVWSTQAGDHINSWLKVKLPAAAVFSGARIQARNSGQYGQTPNAFKIQASHDGNIWVDLYQTVTSWTQNQSQNFYWQNETPYLYYRLLVESVQSGNAASLSTFELGLHYKSYKRDLDKYDYLVPIMTSSVMTTEAGTFTVASSSEHYSHKNYYLFDRSFNTRFELNNGEKSGWLQMELPVSRFINKFCVGSRSDGWASAAPRDYTLLGSSDGSSWDTLYTVSGSGTFASSELREHNLSHSGSYRFYRLNIGNPDSSVLTFARWDLVEKSHIIEY